MSASTETTKASEPSLAKATIDLVWYYLGGRRGLILLTVAILGAGLVLNWSWLVAVGVAPLLLALAPCAAMCALGLCMNKMGKQSGPTQSNSGAQSGAAKPPSTTTPAVEVRDETLTVAVEPRISNATNERS
ncbi:MAG: hypothetical protein HYY77_16055 [Betaproteobacteria bacterium]|nr:hypothetical protein [Betaproteobacteria bacterium]